MLRGMAWLNLAKTKEPFAIFKTVSILVIFVGVALIQFSWFFFFKKNYIFSVLTS